MGEVWGGGSCGDKPLGDEFVGGLFGWVDL